MLDNNAEIEELITAVGTWSHDNFGEQPVLCPIAGMAEEILLELPEVQSPEEEVDSLADCFIFACDAIYRAGAVSNVSLLFKDANYCNGFVLGREDIPESEYDLGMAIGAMSQATLKNYQGIKKWKDPEVYKQDMARFFYALFVNLDDVMMDGHKVGILPAAVTVFNTIVSKRNWKACSTTGQSDVSVVTPDEGLLLPEPA